MTLSTLKILIHSISCVQKTLLDEQNYFRNKYQTLLIFSICFYANNTKILSLKIILYTKVPCTLTKKLEHKRKINHCAHNKVNSFDHILCEPATRRFLWAQKNDPKILAARWQLLSHWRRRNATTNAKRMCWGITTQHGRLCAAVGCNFLHR